MQPLWPHKHWHIDVTSINIAGAFFYQCSLLDGCSRFVIHWRIHETMTEADIKQIVHRPRERFLEARTRVISDNEPQFVARDFQGIHSPVRHDDARTSPYDTQSNGKTERWHRILKEDCIHPDPGTTPEGL